MNPGKRLLRNTVFTIWGLIAAFVALNRVNAWTGEEKSPWLTLGFQPMEHRQARPGCGVDPG